MERIIKEQLAKIKYKYEQDNNIITIQKQGELSKDVSVGNCYLIKVENYILNPPVSFTLHENWNKGVKPLHQYMKVEVTKILGKMIQVHAVGYDFENKKDLDDIWEGWLPQKSVEIIQEI